MVHLIHGSDTYRSRKLLQKLVQEYEKRGAELVFYDFEEQSLKDLKQEMHGGSLFDEDKIILARHILKSKDQQDVIDYLKKLKKESPHPLIIYISEDLDAKARAKKTTKSMKALIKAIKLADKEYSVKALSKVDSAKWIVGQAEAMNISLPPAVATHLVTHTIDSWKLVALVNKLSALNNNAPLTLALLQEHLVRPEKIETTVFPLLDALASNNKTKTLQELSAAFEKDPKAEFYILTMFLYQFKNILVVKDLLERGYDQNKIKAELKLHPFVLQKNLSFARKYSLEQLKDLLNKLYSLSDKFVTSKLSSRLQLEIFVLEL